MASFACDMSELEHKQQGGVTTVTLNRPDQRNALSATMIIALKELFEKLSHDETTRMIVLQGEGKCFCAGADIADMKSDTSTDELSDMFDAIGNCPKPLVAIVQGAAIGGGLGLVACCDVVLAMEDTKFSLSEVRLGILPAVIMPYVKRKIGFSQLSRYMLTAERITTEKALKINLVHELFTDQEQMKKVAEEITIALLKGAPQAQSLCKSLIRELDEVDFEGVSVLAKKTISDQRVTPEAQEGLQAFLEKRSPNWVKE